jgi:hypothetical protein
MMLGMQLAALLVATLVIVCLTAHPVTAQVAQVTTPPPNLLVPNYDTVPVGPFGGLEGTAYAARVGDPSAAWFNPAGLVRLETAQISGSAGVYEHTSVSPQSLPNQGGSIQQLPNYVGFTLRPRDAITVGAALVTTNSWNQETDAQLFTTLPTGQERFAYSADSQYSQRILAMSAGYRGTGSWRFGGGLGFSLVNLRLVQSTSDRIGDATGLQSLLVSSRVSGSALQLRSQVGAQYDWQEWRFGGAIRTPALTLYRSGSITLDGVLDSHAGSYGASLFDTNARFDFHLPWEFQGGAAYVGDRFELELDLLAHTPVNAYSLISTNASTLVYGSAGPNVPPSVVPQPFPGLTSESNGVVNVGVGGHVRPLQDRDFRIHGGIGSSLSPVGVSDTVFSKVDLLTWTLGVSGTWSKFQFSAGFNHQSGTATNITLRNLLNGATVNTSADVRTNGLIYSLAYQF